ncbi:hypothetical protein ACFV9G_06095 [Nocardioides sp. NPDC059952]|uniref:hypothetical protein n=1 Tax=Nocardioides sp. NPDC059952 TaxID=3347014 RepID=UPI00365B7B35
MRTVRPGQSSSPRPNSTPRPLSGSNGLSDGSAVAIGSPLPDPDAEGRTFRGAFTGVGSVAAPVGRVDGASLRCCFAGALEAAALAVGSGSVIAG